jgi:hypothetical protein
MPDDTPPPVPQAPATVGTISRQLQGVAGQLHGARNDLDGLTERVRLLQRDAAESVGVAAELRKRLLELPPPPAAPDVGASLTPRPRPSLAVQAAVKGGSVGKYLLIVIGALGVAAQVAALFKPNIVGPIQTLIQLLQALAGHS